MIRFFLQKGNHVLDVTS